jgi:hypothetical protein
MGINSLPSTLFCSTWSVTGALPVTKGHLCPLPKWVFHVVYPPHLPSKDWPQTLASSHLLVTELGPCYEQENDEGIFLHYYLLSKMQQNGPSGPVVVGQWPCEPDNPTLLSFEGRSHLKRESHPSHIKLVCWDDWPFPRGVRRSVVLRLQRSMVLRLPRHNKRP